MWTTGWRAANVKMDKRQSWAIGIAILLTLAMCPAPGAGGPDTDIGTFWQVTDIHYDANYSETGSDLNCHDIGTDDKQHNGRYGNHRCDAPWALVTSAVEAMRKIEPDPDFILWTGDTVAHLPDDQLTSTKVYSLINNVTNLLRDVFPNVTILPSLGNHDAWPANQVSLAPDSYYSALLEYAGWGKLLAETSKETFIKGGYYSQAFNPGLRLLNLNTILWYEQNHFAFNRPDPSNQLAWLQEQLTQARSKGEKIILFGHIPPGMLARVAHFSWYVPQFNNRLVALLQQNYDVISAFITGHEHTDGFHIVNDNMATEYIPRIPIFMSPSVSPWRSNIPGMGANNPGIRLYTFDKNTGSVLDFKQFYLNLTQANSMESTEWSLEYQAAEAYMLENITAESLNSLVSNFLREDSKLFKTYFTHNSVGYDVMSECVDECKQMHICAIMFVDYDQYQRCMQKYERAHLVPYKVHRPTTSTVSAPQHNASTAPRHNITDIYHGHAPHPYPPGPKPVPHYHKPGYMHYVIYGLVTLVVLLFIVITLLCCCFRPNNRVVYFTQPRYVLVS